MRQAVAHDVSAAENLEHAEQLHNEDVRKFTIPFIAQLLRKSSPIPSDEVCAALLTEEPETIRILLSTLGDTGREEAKTGALQVIAGAAFDGFSDPLLEEKLAALGVRSKAKVRDA